MRTTTAPAKKNVGKKAHAPKAAAKPNPHTVRVRPKDRLRLEELSQKWEIPLGAVVMSAVSAGEFMIHDEGVASKLEGLSANHYLWWCIHRKSSDYTDLVPILPDQDGSFLQAEADARQLNREMADWCGPLIRIGLPALENAMCVRAIAACGEGKFFAQAIAFECMQKGGMA
ncbi:MAG: hypothetical protein QM680_10550 [Luteolibacter sp.]